MASNVGAGIFLVLCMIVGSSVAQSPSPAPTMDSMAPFSSPPVASPIGSPTIAATPTISSVSPVSMAPTSSMTPTASSSVPSSMTPTASSSVPSSMTPTSLGPSSDEAMSPPVMAFGPNIAPTPMGGENSAGINKLGKMVLVGAALVPLLL